MSATGLRCRECGIRRAHAPVHVCEECFGALEVVYDYDAIGRALTRERIARRPLNLWRYHELLPLDAAPALGGHSGWTPLVRADRLAAALGVDEVYIKDESANHPTWSYKDRVVPVAIAKAIELGLGIVACASTGNLANSVAAHAARAGLPCLIFIPADLEAGRIVGSAVYAPHTIAVRGTYDDVNRLCSEVADKYGWGFVNINLRPYYTEGAKTLGFEIVEQLGWSLPRHVVLPAAGGTLLPRVARGFRELIEIGLARGERPRIHCAQADGCAPIIQALHRHGSVIEPVKPRTIAASIAVGDPGDGFAVLQEVRESGGWGEAASDDEMLAGIDLLARTEGLFTEPAGGATIAVTRKLIAQGRIARDESVVIGITASGYKALQAVAARVAPPFTIEPRLQAFDAVYRTIEQRI